MFKEVSFEGFDGWEEDLRKIKRYNVERRTQMFYRTDLWLHSRRVYVLVRDVFPEVLIKCVEFDSENALTLALVHDDAEIITGDIQQYDKDRMSEKELARVDEDEAKAIEDLSKRWPSEINGFNYRALLLHALRKDCVEEQVVSYCDKFGVSLSTLYRWLNRTKVRIFERRGSSEWSRRIMASRNIMKNGN